MSNGKTVIAIEDVERLWDKIRDINEVPFDDIVWTLDGKEFDIHPTFFRFWMQGGHDNMTFITSGAYKWGNVLATLAKK